MWLASISCERNILVIESNYVSLNKASFFADELPTRRLGPAVHSWNGMGYCGVSAISFDLSLSLFISVVMPCVAQNYCAPSNMGKSIGNRPPPDII